MNIATLLLLKLMGAMFNMRPALNRYLRSSDGWINFTIGFRTEDGTVNRALTFEDGAATVKHTIPEGADAVLRFKSRKALREMLNVTPNEMLTMILHNRMSIDGNFAYVQLFNFYVSLLMGKKHDRMLKRAHAKDMASRKKEYGTPGRENNGDMKKRNNYRMKAPSIDRNVLFLDDPYLSDYSIDDFPRLKKMLKRHFDIMPELCIERPRLLTDWFRENGFETDSDNNPWDPELRQARAFKHLMSNKKPLIAEDELIAGTTTAKEPTGVVIYPDAQGIMLWGELKSISKRILNPYKISDEDADILHREIFPFWAERNFREYVRRTYNSPLCQKIDEHWVYYFVWKSVGISHTIPDYPQILNKGSLGLIADIDKKLTRLTPGKKSQRNSLTAMKTTLEGLNCYSKNLSREAAKCAAASEDSLRKKELQRIAGICSHVPMRPARTLDEAVHTIWITWVAIHMESTNTGLSLGRLDQWLQPYFAGDMKKLKTKKARQKYISYAIELIGCLLMRGTDHLPLVPDIGNYLFGGSSSDQAITLGGVTRSGKDGVNDMTYIFLKATEMLSIRDPNINARYHAEKNSSTYLKRLCEVNYITAATPSMHNDISVFQSLGKNRYAREDIRDWSATGCVEPTLSGKHMGHTGSILMNMVSALEMALNNGRHPHVGWQLGPQTGSIENGDFRTFDDFFDAYKTQQKFLIDQAVELNNHYAEAHARYRPTPLLSSLMDGCIEKGRDVTAGGARYNTSGSSNIGLADVTDSLMVIRKLVFDEKKVTFSELKNAIDSDFHENPGLHAMVTRKIALFGSGSEEALDIARDVTRFVHDTYRARRNYRGGRYTTGFWSMSQHVAYGTLSGTLPSGRLKGKAFTPGLTPHPSASHNFLDNIRDVAGLDPGHLDNNIAFNVKLSTSPRDSREEIIDAMHSYIKTYFDLGGMQMQFNMVNSETLKDAMANPEKYKNLLVRISGYNAYFVTLNRDMQIELIERAQYGM